MRPLPPLSLNPPLPLIFVNDFDESTNQHLELEVKTSFQSKTNIDIISIEYYNSLQKLHRIVTAWVF